MVTRAERAESGDDNKIVVWTGDTIPDRVAKSKAIIAKFTEKTGIQVELVGVDEDQFNQLLTSAAAAGELPDVVGTQPLAAIRTLSANDLLNTEATAAIIESLGADTFSARSLELTREGDTQLSVPSDAWSQLLYYRKDLFEDAGLKAPQTYDDIMAAAKALDSSKVAGFVGATTPGDAFTQQTFEHLALANGCQMVDQAGEVTMDSPQCVAAFQFYGDLIKSYSVSGTQDVDTVRASLLRRSVGDGDLVHLPARRAGRTAQRRQAQLCGVQEGPGVPGQEHRRGGRRHRSRRNRTGPVRRGLLLGDHRHRKGRALPEVHRVHAQ